MTNIKISEDFMNLEIWEWNDLTEQLFKNYSEWRNQLNKDKAKYRTMKKEVEEARKTVSSPSFKLIKKKKKKAKEKAPHNTMLFKNWLEDQKIVEFTVDDFVKRYPTITKESAMKIVTFQLQQGNLNQMNKNKFRVRKK